MSCSGNSEPVRRRNPRPIIGQEARQSYHPYQCLPAVCQPFSSSSSSSSPAASSLPKRSEIQPSSQVPLL
ncbi:hypothetical protein Q8A67_016629 [Cirrhinus molitorella]|uniref:Uncharacterized protein n=1 Tax=Cirrhinus molitorella TaxID=172907 RepID=A0AA88PIE5_9TELE|nr:hypothetical protein Q8A67_016629 [Cirrhinus molitorella]